MKITSKGMNKLAYVLLLISSSTLLVSIFEYHAEPFSVLCRSLIVASGALVYLLNRKQLFEVVK